MFSMGFQPAKRSFFLGQVLSQADRDHYLVAVGRAVTEANEIDKWLKDNPTATLKPPTETTPPSGMVISPYFTKWINFQPIRPEMQKLNDRLSNADPTTWSSLTPEEHTTFGWVSVVDQIFSAFKADPKNLTAGKWQNGVRAADEPVAGAAIPSTEEPITIPVLNTQLPPTIVGIPTKTVLIGGGVVIGLAIVVSLLR
jgi:hypothetical protein